MSIKLDIQRDPDSQHVTRVTVKYGGVRLGELPVNRIDEASTQDRRDTVTLVVPSHIVDRSYRSGT